MWNQSPKVIELGVRIGLSSWISWSRQTIPKWLFDCSPCAHTINVAFVVVPVIYPSFEIIIYIYIYIYNLNYLKLNLYIKLFINLILNKLNSLYIYIYIYIYYKREVKQHRKHSFVFTKNKVIFYKPIISKLIHFKLHI